jgi:hypothetical protein
MWSETVHGGAAGELKQPDFPGGQCPDHRLLGQPHLIEPFGARMRKASQAAIDVMRGRIPESGTLPSVADTPPAASGNDETPDPLPTTDQAKLTALLKQQAILAADMTPEGEAKYQAVVAEIAALS